MSKTARIVVSICISAVFLVLASTSAHARAKRDYVITGRIMLADNTPLVNVKVQAGGNRTNSRTLSWKRWKDAVAYTDDKGYFRITTKKSAKKRRIRVWMQLVNEQIVVREYLADVQANARPIAESDVKTNDATISFGDRVIGGNISEYVHTNAVRRALEKKNNVTRAEIFSVMHNVVKHMESYESGLGFEKNKRIVAYFPVSSAKASWAIGNTINLVASSTVHTWIHEMGHTWIYQHDEGTWLCDWGKHSAMCENGAFNEGYAEYFARSLMPTLGYSDKDGEAVLNMNKYDAEPNQLSLDDLERDMKGVATALQMMTNPTLCEHHGYERDDPEISFEDVSSVFLPDSDAGWSTNWEVGRPHYGVWRFFDRAVDILPQFTEEYQDLVKAKLNSDLSKEELHAKLSSVCGERISETETPVDVLDDASPSDEEPPLVDEQSSVVDV